MKKLKKIFLVGAILGTTSLFAASTTGGQGFYSNYLSMLNSDVETVNNIMINNLENINNNKLGLLNLKIQNISNELEVINQRINLDNLSPEEQSDMFNQLATLSTDTYKLATLLANIGNNQLNNASEDYKYTFKTLVDATLRLSDDIGKMADRIGEMADRIVIVSGQIVETQKIQSVNYQKTLELLKPFK